MSIPFVDLREQYLAIKGELDEAIQKVFDQSTFIGGETVTAFESDFAKYIGAQHCVGCGNGTDAIEMALMALGIGSGDEVIVPALSWISTASAVNNVGAKPVFVDVLPLEGTLNAELVVEKISSRTKAIVPVHLHGLPARMTELRKLADEHGLKLIEDTAQAPGAEIDGRKTGTFGDIATFSFYPSKNLGAYGDGGAIVTNDAELADFCRRIGNHGQLKKHDHGVMARNSRLDAVQAACLQVKLHYLDEWNRSRINNANRYNEQLVGEQTPSVPAGFKHVYHVYAIRSEVRDELIKRLNASGIGYGIHYPTPLPLTDLYKDYGATHEDFPVATRICNETLSLPMYPELRPEQIDQVVDSLGCE